MTSLFTVVSYELAQQVLTDNVRFSSAGYARTMGEGWARGPWARAGQEDHGRGLGKELRRG